MRETASPSSKTSFINIVKLTKSKLFKQRTVPETFQCITSCHMETVSVIALCLLGALPLLCAIADHYLNSGLTVLYCANSGIGYFGLIFYAFLLVWRHYQSVKLTLKERIHGNGLPVFLLLMLVWSAISCAFSTNPTLSFTGDWYRLDGLMSYFAYAGIFIFACQVRSRNNWRLIMTFFSTTASILALLCLLDIPRINIFLNIQTDRAIFFNINHYGYYLCMAIPAAVGLLITDDSGKEGHGKWYSRIFYCAEIALLTNGLIKAHSLGPLLAVDGSLAGALILGAFIDRVRLKRTILAIAVFTVVASVSSSGTWNIILDFQNTSDEIGMVADKASGFHGKDAAPSGTEQKEVDINHIGSNRGILWINAVRFITERPLLGYGPDNLGEAYAQVGCNNDRPHCEPLQFAASLGIPAAVFYLGGLLCLLVEFVKKFRKIDIVVLSSFCVAGAYLLSSTVGNTMFYTSPFFFMNLGIAYGQIKNISA